MWGERMRAVDNGYFCRLALEMANGLDNIQFGKRVTRISQSGSGVVIETADGQSWQAEQVVIALPFSVLRTLDLQLDLPAYARRACRRSS